MAEHLDDPPSLLELREGLEPRLTCAVEWMTRHVPDEERTHVREGFSADAWAALTEDQRGLVERFREHLEGPWTLDGLTRLVYGIPKVALGFDMDDPPNPDIKATQKAFFVALYTLLVGKERGPRLPTLLLSIGQERTRALVTPA